MSEEEKIKKMTFNFIEILEKCDEEKFKEIWHQKAIRFSLGNTNELMTMNKEEMIKFSLDGLRNLKKQIPNPNDIKFTIDEIINIKCIENVIAFSELRWHMTLPESKGKHHTLIQFAKENGKWLIINVLDKGYEEEEEEEK